MIRRALSVLLVAWLGVAFMAFPATPLDIKAELALGADLTADPSTWAWTDITTYVRNNPTIHMSRGRGDRWQRTGPGQVQLTLDNSDGRFTRLNPLGAYYGQLRRNTPLRVRINPGSGYVTRFTGYVSKWPPRWDKSGNDQYAPITADGIMRRLGKSSTVQSAAYRTIVGGTRAAHAYWPLEDGVDAGRFASPLLGVPNMTIITPTTLAFDSAVVGSRPLPLFGIGAGGSGSIPAHADTGSWYATAFAHTDDFNQTFTVLNIEVSGGTTAHLAVGYDTGNLVTAARDAENNVINISTDAHGQSVSGQVYTFVVGMEDNASGTNDYVYARMIDAAGNTIASINVSLGAGQYGLGTHANPNGRGTLHDQGIVGHVTYFTDAGFALGTDDVAIARAAGGWLGETVDDRVGRLCAEESAPIAIVGASGKTMGVQPVASLLDALRECEDVDLGLLHETLDGKLRYLCNSARYNSATAITLDYAAGQVHEPFSPDDDDTRLHNKVIVSRPDGSSTTAVDQDSIDAEGEYRLPHTANTETDAQLDDVAGWLKHLGTIDEARYPSIGINLAANTGLIASWLAADIGGRLLLDNLPSPLPDSSEQIIEGYTETLHSFGWHVVANCGPASPYDVYEVEDEVLGRADTDGSELATQFIAGTNTSMSVAVTDGPLWITTADHAAMFPFEIRCSGARLTVTGISGGSSPQTFTVSTTVVNGVAKTIPSGEPVSLWTPARAAL